MARGNKMEKNYKRTNVYVINKEMWNWAQYQAKNLGHKSVSEYLFKLIEKDKTSKKIKGTVVEHDLRGEPSLEIEMPHPPNEASVTFSIEGIFREYQEQKIEILISRLDDGFEV